MKVVVTGGCGFLGTRLTARLLERGELTAPDGRPAPIDDILLADATGPDERHRFADDRVSYARGDIADPAWTASLVDRDDTSIFHLASIVSAQAEAEPALAHRVNIDGARSILARGGGPRRSRCASSRRAPTRSTAAICPRWSTTTASRPRSRPTA